MSHARMAIVIDINRAHIKLPQDRGANSTWLQDYCGVVSQSTKLESGSDQQGTPLRVVARVHPFQLIALAFAS